MTRGANLTSIGSLSSSVIRSDWRNGGRSDGGKHHSPSRSVSGTAGSRWPEERRSSGRRPPIRIDAHDRNTRGDAGTGESRRNPARKGIGGTRMKRLLARITWGHVLGITLGVLIGSAAVALTIW